MTTLVATLPEPHLSGWRLDPTHWSVLIAVLRRLSPQLFEATLFPSALYLVGVLTVGLRWGVLAAAGWVAVSIVRRRVSDQPVSTLLLLAAAGMSIRGGIYLLNENGSVYFVQPIIRTSVTAILFAASALAGRPLVARFAGDFCDFDDTVRSRPAISALFRRLTFLWAGALAVTAAVHLTLLLTVPVSVFVGTAVVSAWLIIAGCVTMTVCDSVRTARSDGLRTAISSNGQLSAFLAPIT